jgi:predicted LPLAT superfamily acyltransferase
MDTSHNRDSFANRRHFNTQKANLDRCSYYSAKMHDRVNTLARGLIDKGQVHITDDEFKAIAIDFGNITLTDSSLFEQILQPKSEALDIIKEKSAQIYEQIAIFQVQFGICFEKHKKILSAVKVKDRKYKSMKRQVDNLVFPITDKKIIDSVKGFTITSDGLNNLFLVKPYLLESSLVKNNLTFSSSMLVYLERLDESIDIQIGERRRQVAEAIDDYIRQRSRGKKD